MSTEPQKHRSIRPDSRPNGQQSLAMGAAIMLVLAMGLPVFTVLFHLLAPIGPVWQHLAATVLPGYVGHSVILVLGVTGLALVIAVPAAWLVAIYDFPGRRWVSWALLLPTAVPAYIAAYSYTDLLQFAGPVQTWLRAVTGLRHGDYWFPPIRSTGGAIFVMAMVFYPYIYLFARQAFGEQGRGLLAAARSLGHGPCRSFVRVALPAARPALAGGAALVAMETLADFATVDFFAVPTFTTGIYRTWFNMGAPLAAARLSAWLVLLALCLLVIERLSRHRMRFFLNRSYGRLPLLALGGWRGCVALVACMVPVFAGFVVPVAMLMRLGLGMDFAVLLDGIGRLLGDSLILAGLAAFGTVLVAILSVVLIQPRHPIRSILVRISGLGYAVPGTVMAVGMLIPAGWIDRNLGYALVNGSIGLLIYAYIVRFLSVAREAIEAGHQRLSPTIGQAALLLGAGWGRRWARIYAPLMAPTWGMAAMMVGLDVIKELPATLILRPFDFETLAVRVYRYAGDERLAEAAAPALCMIVLGVVPIMMMSWFDRRSRQGHL